MRRVLLICGAALLLLTDGPNHARAGSEANAAVATMLSHKTVRVSPRYFAQRCSPPQCRPDEVQCNIRREPNGCLTWDCCRRR